MLFLVYKWKSCYECKTMYREILSLQSLNDYVDSKIGCSKLTEYDRALSAFYVALVIIS